jgi:hypothetical protein
MFEKGQASHEEALKFMVEYLKINEPEKRRRLFCLAEQYSREGRPLVSQDNEAN